MDVTLGVDIGGTKVAGGVVDRAGRILHRARAQTPDRSTSARAVEDALVDVVHALVRATGESARVRAVGVGAAGWVSNDRSTVLFLVHVRLYISSYKRFAKKREPFKFGKVTDIGKMSSFIRNVPQGNYEKSKKYSFNKK